MHNKRRAPVAQQRPVTTTVFGMERSDPYYWLRERDNPDVLAHLEAENAYTAAVLQHTEGLQRELFDELVSHIDEREETAPARQGDYWYYTRIEAGKQYRVLYRRAGTSAPSGPEEVLLDENVMAEGQTYFRLGAVAVSPDACLLAYSVDLNGGERFDLYVKDLGSGEVIDGPIPNASYAIEWAADSRTLLYVTSDAMWRTDKLYRHALGSDAAQDVLIYHERDDAYWLNLDKTRSNAYFVLHLKSNTSSEIRLFPADQPDTPARLVIPRRPGIECSIEHSGEWLYLRTNEDARNFKVVRLPVAQLEQGMAAAEPFVPHNDDVSVEGMAAFARQLALYEREHGLQQIRIIELASGAQHRIAFDEPVYALEAWQPFFNAEFDTPWLRFGYSSLVEPPAVFDYEMDSRERVLRKRQVVPGYTPEQYRSERVFVAAADGAQVPMSLVYRADTPRDGSAPLFLYGYGAYGYTIDPAFDARRLPLLDRGFVYAIGHIRGGSDMGRAWYEQGKLLNKRNSFSDFIACAEYLLAHKYGDPTLLAIKGRSAGGLLMGAVTTMRPDLFRAVIAGVPFVDVVNTSLDPSLPLVVNEYEEWGDPRIEEHYQYLLSYSPYDNTRPAAYPFILATAGLYDPRVQYWEPAKWVARLRDVKTDQRHVLLKTEMIGGHAGPTGRYDYLKDVALEYAFVLDALGMVEQRP